MSLSAPLVSDPTSIWRIVSALYPGRSESLRVEYAAALVSLASSRRTRDDSMVAARRCAIDGDLAAARYFVAVARAASRSVVAGAARRRAALAALKPDLDCSGPRSFS